MAVDFSAFDEQVDLNELQKEVQEADDSQFDDVPDGTYEVSFDKMEIKQTKAKDKLMFSVQCSILDGDQKGRKIFFNRTISGNTSPKWTNGMAIKSVCTWLDKLETDTVPEFVNCRALRVVHEQQQQKAAKEEVQHHQRHAQQHTRLRPAPKPALTRSILPAPMFWAV